VVFIMLIFFIVTSSFVKEPGVEIDKPGATTTEACPNGTIIFAVDDQGKIHYNKNPIKLERASFLAKAAKDETPRANIVIQADYDSPGYVVEELFDSLRSTFTAPPCLSTIDE
ncbi:MAG: biopolymer transporter ExbD, partial [Gammaproteobacteria bacterium]